MPTLGLDNRIANEALNEERRANKRVMKNLQRQVVDSNRTELPPTQIERRTVYEIDMATTELSTLLGQYQQQIQDQIGASSLQPGQQQPPPLDLNFSNLFPIWNKIVSIIGIYVKNPTNNATPNDRKFIATMILKLQAPIETILTMIEQFSKGANIRRQNDPNYPRIFGDITGLNKLKDLRDQVRDASTGIYSKIAVFSEADINAQVRSGQLGQPAQGFQPQGINIPQQQQAQNMPQQQINAPFAIDTPEPQIAQLFTNPDGSINYPNKQNIIDSLIRGIRQNLNPLDTPIFNGRLTTEEDRIRGVVNIGAGQPIDSDAGRDMLYTWLIQERDDLLQNYQNFADPNMPANQKGDPNRQAQQNAQQGQQQPIQQQADAIRTQLMTIPAGNRPNAQKIGGIIRAFLKFSRDNQGANPFQPYDRNALMGAVVLPRSYDTQAKVNQVYDEIERALPNWANAFGGGVGVAPLVQGYNTPISQNVFGQTVQALLNYEQQTGIPALTLQRARDFYRDEYNATQQQNFPLLNAIAGAVGSRQQADITDFIHQAGQFIEQNRQQYIQATPGLQQQGTDALLGRGMYGGRNDRANTGSLFLGTRGNPENPRERMYGMAHPLSRMLGGADDDENYDDQYIDVGNEYPNVGIDPQYWRDPGRQPATQAEILWRTAGRASAWGKAGITNLAQFTRWMSVNAIHYAQLVLTDPNVISAAKKAGKSTGDFVYDNPAVLVGVLPYPLNVLAVATAIVGYMGRDWWRANVGRGGAVGSLEQTRRLLYRGDMINNSANSMYPGYIDRYVATQVPDFGLSNPYYRTPQYQQDIYMLGTGMEELNRGRFDSKGQYRGGAFLRDFSIGNRIPQECMSIMNQPITMDYDPQPDGSQNKMASRQKQLYQQCLERNKIETPPQNVGLPNFMKGGYVDEDMYMKDPDYNKFRTRNKLQQSTQPLFGLPLNVDSGRVMEQNDGKHFRALPVREGKYIHRNKPYINAELFDDTGNELYRGMDMERPNYGTNVMEEAPKHKAMVEEMRAEDGFFAKKHAKKLGLKKDVSYFK